MGKYILTGIFSLVFCINIFSQNIISPNLGYGYYLSNSENSLKIMGDKRYKSYLFFGLSFQKKIYGYNLMVEYNYHQIEKENVIEFFLTSSFGADPIGLFGGDISLINHNIDFDYVGNINNYFFYGIGPSFVITNRIFEIKSVPWGESFSSSHYDKLASSGLGINGFIMLNAPLTESSKFSIIAKLKFRYTYSIWFDEGIRNLDDYYQEFLSSQLLLGIGYSF